MMHRSTQEGPTWPALISRRSPRFASRAGQQRQLEPHAAAVTRSMRTRSSPRHCSHAPRCSHRLRTAAAACPQPAKRPAWPVTLRMVPLVTVPLPRAAIEPDAGCGLEAYMTLPTSHYTLLPLPLGATLSRHRGGARARGAGGDAGAASNSAAVAPRSDDLFALTIPRVQLFSLVVQPTIVVAVQVLPRDAGSGDATPAVLITASDSRVDGAWAEQLGLNERFEIYGTTRFTWAGEEITSTTDLRVGVDPPPPFSRLPVSLLERVGNAVLGAVCAQLQRVFVRALGEDYRRWSSDGAYRAARAAWQAQEAAADGVQAAAALAAAADE